jgi:putative PIN family toxin of toxin-antitoxin system
MAEDGAIHLAVSDAILDEVERVLRRDKFGWPEEEIDKAIRQITRFTEHVEPKQRIDAVKEDPTDNRILECAAASGSDYLVSGDKHLLKLGQYQGIKIVSPADFIQMVGQHGRGR